MIETAAYWLIRQLMKLLTPLGLESLQEEVDDALAS